MSTTDVQSRETGRTAARGSVDLKLEVVVIPVADADRSKEFYAGLGWRLDADFSFDNGFRVVQFTPPGSLCSIQFGTKITAAAPDPRMVSTWSFPTSMPHAWNSSIEERR